ncbi:MAG: phosphatidate cytidylyltransferase [Chloroflexi bacterium]|nr:phosphatidate cytidylyltransferase [Chloroflexota bacterium]
MAFDGAGSGGFPPAHRVRDEELGATAPERSAAPGPNGRPVVPGLTLRLVTAAVAIPIVVACVVAGGVWFSGLILALAAVVAGEIWLLQQRAGHRASPVAALAAALAFPLSAAAGAPQLGWLLLALGIFVTAIPLGASPARHGTLTGWGVSVALGLYVGALLAPGIALRQRPDGLEWLLLVLAATWACDTVAFLVGWRWGRHQLAPTVSPAKSVEGAVAGLVAAVVVAAGASMLLPLPLLRLIGLGSVVGAGAVVGDLIESAVKRQLGAKDSGWIMPGHGGLLDRLDSLLVTGFLGYLYVTATDAVGAP